MTYEWSDIDELRETEEDLRKTRSAIVRAEARKTRYQELIKKHETAIASFRLITNNTENSGFQKEYALKRIAAHEQAISDFNARVVQIGYNISELKNEESRYEGLVAALKLFVNRVERSQLMSNDSNI